MLELHASQRTGLQSSDHEQRWWQTEATNTPCGYVSLPVGCFRADMPFTAEASPALALDASNASARLVGSTGREVHIVGVSHTSPFYGNIAADAINSATPRQVVLEVCEGRLAEQAVRGAQALSSQHSELVKNAVRPFLGPEALWTTITKNHSLHAWHEHRLANEGSAQLEGGFYGSEVTQAANAATACGAEIIAADRSRPLSRARLHAAMRHKLEEELSQLGGGDTDLITHAVAVAVHNLTAAAGSVVSGLSQTQAARFGNAVHPIFHAAACGETRRALQALGCDVDALVAALDRLMAHGSAKSAQIDDTDLSLVRACIRTVEEARHAQRCQHATAAAASAARRCGDAAGPLKGPSSSSTAQSALAWIPAANELEADVDAAVDRREQGGESGTPVPGGMGQERGRSAWLWADWRSWLERKAAAMESAYQQTTVAERDCILAHRLRRLAEEGEGPIVAVVGANHVSGIVAAWETALTPEFQGRCEAFLTPPPPTAPAPAHAWKAAAIDSIAWALEGVAVTALAGAAATGAQRMLPRCPRVAGGAAAAVVGASVCAGHAWWSMYTRPARLVENLARYNDAAAAVGSL
eukprot:jgi/Ulvmu1/11236/UM073_0008.1